LHLTSYLDDGKLIIELTGEIDHHCARDYIDAISGKIEAYNPKLCVLDFENVSFMDSSGIAVIINSFRCVSGIEGRLALVALQAQPKKIVKASGIDKLVEIKESAV